MPYPNGYYCCHCPAGPWISAVFEHCMECGHAFCPGCTPTYINVQKSSPSQGKQRNRRLSNGKQFHATSSKRLRSRHISILAGTNVGSSMLLQNHATDTSHVHLLNPVPPITVPIEFPEIISSYPTPSDGEAVWTCCNCFESGSLVGTTPGCLKCEHRRCSKCGIEEVRWSFLRKWRSIEAWSVSILFVISIALW